MRVLVTGGAGYIGSVVVEDLLAAGAERVVVVDSLVKGHAAAVTPPAVLVQADIGDREAVARACRDHRVDAVIHMAAASLVGESVVQPERYYLENVVKGLALLDTVREAGVRRLVFSSTAATYGEPERTPITEDFPNHPTNPYGETKLAFERALSWHDRAHGVRFCALRYFNAAGASGRNGEDHEPETHLIPNVLAAARGEREAVSVLGDDYPTPDGTCVRDYIHVKDLARAHLLALAALAEGGSSRTYNLGAGGGFSVRQVIEAAAEVTGRRIPATIAPRRPGDPAVLVASSERIHRELGWQPERDLRVILTDAWRWLEAHPRRYA